VVAQIGDPELGLRLAERFELGDVDLFGYLVRNCPHALMVMHELARYSRLIGDAIDCQVASRGPRVVVSVGLWGARQMAPEIVDYFMGTIGRVIRELTRGIATPIEVHLARPKPARPASYRNFFRAPVKFEAKRCALYYSEQAARTPIADADTRLLTILEQRAEARLSELPPRANFIEYIRRCVDHQLEVGPLALGHVAERLGMSERTLRRRLKQNGLGYRQLIDDIRRDHALRLAKDHAYNVSMIAYRVGFNDTTAFTRAFRRWTGAAPAKYLQQVRTRPPHHASSRGDCYEYADRK
jgi:AraC-like DNA-binding protein